MIIKDYKYENSTDGIHYIIDVDGYKVEMNHTNVNNIKRSITIEGIELGSDCQALVSKHQDGTGTITLVFDGKIV